MAYWQYTNQPTRIAEYEYSREYDHRPVTFPRLSNDPSEPHVLVDLRNHFTDAKPSSKGLPSHGRSHHNDRSYSQDSDYICPAPSPPNGTSLGSGRNHFTNAKSSSKDLPSHNRSHDRSYSQDPAYICRAPTPPNVTPLDNLSHVSIPRHHVSNASTSRYRNTRSERISIPSTSRSRHSQSDRISDPPISQRRTSHASTSHSRDSQPGYTSHVPVSSRYHASSSASNHYAEHASATDQASPQYKSDYQIIKEGGWDNRKEFMESHGLSIYEPGDFDAAKELLDQYRRADARAADGGMYEPDYVPRYADRHRDEDSIDDGYEDEGRMATARQSYTSRCARPHNGSDEVYDRSIHGYHGRRGHSYGDNGRFGSDYTPPSGESEDFDDGSILEYRSRRGYSDDADEWASSEHARPCRGGGDYDESSILGYDVQQMYPERSDQDESSDDDSTGAIGYYSDSDVHEDAASSDNDSTDAINYYSDSDRAGDDEPWGDDFVEDVDGNISDDDYMY